MSYGLREVGPFWIHFGQNGAQEAHVEHFSSQPSDVHGFSVYVKLPLPVGETSTRRTFIQEESLRRTLF